MNLITEIQTCQLSKNNNTVNLLNTGAYPPFLAEMSAQEGELIPFVIRIGPVGKPDIGLLKRYEAIEINGEGSAYVMAWVQNRLVAFGRIFAQEGPKRPRRLNILRGLGSGYDIDLYIAFQGRLTGYEVFYEVIENGGEA